MDYLEIFGTAVGVAYLILEYRASAWLWLAGLVMPVIYLFVYYRAGLYADFAISVYYILASLYGIFCWMFLKNKKSDTQQITISVMPRRYWVAVTALFFVLFGVIGILLSQFTDSTVPWADAFTTALSIVAMWMLARKYVEQWLLWILADVACAVLYVYKDLWFTGALYLAYAVIAIFGYRKWKVMMQTN